ncbi:MULTISPECIES: helix-turn-helix domain-containing protein [Kordiimonadales]|uniref:XRE family transcriptional regulator n=1 Tax=Gimibacter soli TaxID=3024400 RepID=A0AAE9XWA7_9PROT|nr:MULTISPECIES: XRE family transcriptional regulator [Kordiimonadales]WCL55578.1 XRE family transcriptional regulator [Gimibacter soli]
MIASTSMQERDETETSIFLLEVGNRIRARRKERKMTLKDLSEASNVPLSTLSKVETGGMSLNVQKLVSVCKALDLDVMQLVSPEEPDQSGPKLVTGRRSVTHLGQARRVQTTHTLYEHHAADFRNRRLVPTVMWIEAGLEPELVRHQGEEFIFVLEGEVEVQTEFYEPTRLSVGESMYIDSTMGHNVRALGGKPAKILNVMTARFEEAVPDAVG